MTKNFPCLFLATPSEINKMPWATKAGLIKVPHNIITQWKGARPTTRREYREQKQQKGKESFRTTCFSVCSICVCRNTPNEYKIKQYTDVSYFQHTTGLLISERSELSLFSKISRVVFALHRSYVWIFAPKICNCYFLHYDNVFKLYCDKEAVADSTSAREQQRQEDH